jgi:hypothetical protein
MANIVFEMVKYTLHMQLFNILQELELYLYMPDVVAIPRDIL